MGICCIENKEPFTWWCWLIAIIAVCALISSIIIGCLIAYKCEKYHKYEDIYLESKEYKTQYNKFKRLEKQKKEKLLREKSTDLVESYEILDDKNMPKETKIELLMKYIDRSKL